MDEESLETFGSQNWLYTWVKIDFGDVDLILDSLTNVSKYRQAIDTCGLALVERVEDRVIANNYKDKLPITPYKMKEWFNRWK